jgi:DNA-binding NtrC family response regulator
VDPFSVLVVDDELDFIRVLAVRLARRGLKVRKVHTAEDGLAALADEPADVVVLDVRLPGMTGVQALEKIKARHPFTEVVMLTGYADTETSVRVLELGAFDYLVKPVSIEELIGRLQDAYQAKRLRDPR